MKKMKQIFLRKMTKRALKALPVIFLSMLSLLLIVFGCLGALKESGKVRVGVVVPEEDEMALALMNYVENMGEVSSLCEFTRVTQEEGNNKLEQGEISALLVIPRDILSEIYKNRVTQIQMYTPEEPTMEGAMLREFAEAGTSFVLTAKAGNYAAYNLYRKYGKSGSLQEVAGAMNGRDIQFVMQQETLFEGQPVASVDGMSDEERYLVAGVVLVLFFLGIPALQLRCLEPGILSLQLSRKGVSPGYVLVVENVLLSMVLYVSMTAGMLMLMTTQGWEIELVFFLVCLLIVCLVASAFFTMLHVVDSGRAGRILFVFLAALVQIFLAGGIFPVYVLPEVCVRMGEVLPGGLMMQLLYRGMFHGEWSIALLGLAGYGVLFFLISFLLTVRKGRRGA